jgi:hypothetical protein
MVAPSAVWVHIVTMLCLTLPVYTEHASFGHLDDSSKEALTHVTTSVKIAALECDLVQSSRARQEYLEAFVDKVIPVVSTALGQYSMEQAAANLTQVFSPSCTSTDPSYRAFNALLPPSCPLRLESDVFASWYYQHGEGTYRGKSCCYCGKPFSTPGHLERHLHRRHLEALGNCHAKKPACFGAYCDLLRCTDRYVPAPASACNETRMRDLNRRCTALLHACTPDLAPSISPESLRDFHSAVEEIILEVCGRLHCEYVVPSLTWILFTWALRCMAAIAGILLLLNFSPYLKHTLRDSDPLTVRKVRKIDLTRNCCHICFTLG